MKSMILALAVAGALMLVAGCGGGSKSTPMAGMPSGGGGGTPATPMPIIGLPDGHTLESGTIPAGGTMVIGRGSYVYISCPSGGPDCVIMVAADGSATSTGGTPTITRAPDPDPTAGPGVPLFGLPAGHTLESGTIAAGATVTIGTNAEISCPSGGEACVITVSDRGSARSTGGTPIVIVRLIITTPTPTPEPEPGPYTIGEMYDFDSRLINVLPHLATLNRVQIRGGNVPSNVPLDYLQQATRDPATNTNSLTIAYKPVIRYLFGGAAAWNSVATELNRALPQVFHVTVERDTRTIQPSSYSTIDAYYEAARAGVPDGTIVATLATFTVRRNWLGLPVPAGYFHGPPGRQLLVMSDSLSGGDFLTAALHEIYHMLGLPGHVDDPTSIIHSSPTVSSASQIDRAALRGLYSWGDWGSRPILMGETINGTVFGVTGEADGAVPWAYGRRSQGLLTDAVSGGGTVSWEGAVVGFTDDRERVAGEVELEVDLATAYTGQHDLTFDEIRIWEGYWPRTDDPLWNGDGRLDYKVSLDGSGFQRAGGDEGTINGQFFGDTWNDMGGTLHRTDLTAAFGGSR